MLNFELRNYPDIFFGREAEKRCGELLKEIGGTKALIHHSGEQFVLPLIEKIKGYLRDAGLDCIDLGGVVANPLLSKIREGIALCREQKVDCVLAVGGGSVIDSAKGIAMGAVYDGDIWDFYCGKAEPKGILPLGAIATFAGAGSEWSRASVITNEENNHKRSADDFNLMRPAFAIHNPELTFTVPPYQTAAGAADIFSHLFEFYMSKTPDIYLSRQLLAAGMKTVIKYAETAVREPDNYAARSALMITSPFAVSGILRLGLIGDWASHLMEHQMSVEWNIAHGAGLAVLMPVWMKYNLHKNVGLFARFAVDAFGIEYDFDYPERTAMDGIRTLRNFFNSLGLLATVTELTKETPSDETLKKLAGRIPYYGGENKTLIGETFPLNKDDVYNIYKAAL